MGHWPPPPFWCNKTKLTSCKRQPNTKKTLLDSKDEIRTRRDNSGENQPKGEVQPNCPWRGGEIPPPNGTNRRGGVPPQGGANRRGGSSWTRLDWTTPLLRRFQSPQSHHDYSSRNSGLKIPNFSSKPCSWQYSKNFRPASSKKSCGYKYSAAATSSPIFCVKNV